MPEQFMEQMAMQGLQFCMFIMVFTSVLLLIDSFLLLMIAEDIGQSVSNAVITLRLLLSFFYLGFFFLLRTKW